MWIYVFISLEYMLRSGIVGSYGNSTFNHLNNCQNFPLWLYHFTCPQQCVRTPIPLHSHQQLLLSDFLIIAILMGVKCYLFVFFICISLLTNEIKHLFMFLLAVVYFPWRNISLDPLLIFELFVSHY